MDASDFVEPSSIQSKLESSIAGDEEGLIIGDEEEGQADIEMSNPGEKGRRQPVETNLGKVISTIKDIIGRF